MHACNAAYGTHVKGFTDRRNDGDVVEELREYSRRMTELEQRMPLWVEGDDGTFVHADRLRAADQGIEEGTRFDFSTFPEACSEDGVANCPHHRDTTCRCHLPIKHWGHDEAVFWCNLLSNKEWTIDGERQLRPKNPGSGVMVSAFVSEEKERGFGIHVSNEEWEKLKPIRDKFKRDHAWFDVPKPVEGHRRQIGLVLFEYGSKHTKQDSTNDNDLTSGWWNCAKFRVQCDFVIQCFAKLYGDAYQLLLQIDRSSGHMSRGADALCASNIGMKDGGMVKGKAKPGIRDTKVHAEDFGEHLPTDSGDATALGMIDPANPVQYGHYPPKGDQGGRYDSKGPRYNAHSSNFTITIPASWTPGTPINMSVTGLNIPPMEVNNVPATAKAGDKVEVDINIPGSEWWRGVRKGKLQLLFDTGHIDPAKAESKEWINNWGKHKPTDEEQRTMKRASDGKKNAELHLARRRDFREEQTVIEKLAAQHGHLVLASPRYHPELAGLGIEYCWGKGKWTFRREVNDLQSKHLRRNVLISLGDQQFKFKGKGKLMAPPLPVSRVRKFARRARTFRRLFEQFPNREAAKDALEAWKEGKGVEITDKQGKKIKIEAAKSNASFPDMLNKMYKTVKTHANIIDVDFKVCVDGGGAAALPRTS